MREKILKYLMERGVEEVVTFYRHIEKDLGIPKAEARPVMIELRNEGYVELSTAFDQDFEFRRGSGWTITYKGEKYADSIGIKLD